MPFCSFSEGAAMFDVTPIENMFLLEYLPTAPDGFLRVYLYARMLCLHPELGGEIGDVARALRMDEDAVFNAFSYWERQGLVERLTDRPPTYAIRPLKVGAVQTEMDRDYYKYREFNANMQDLFGSQLLHPSQYEMASDWLNVLGFSQDAVLKLLEYELQHGGKQPASVFKRADKRAADWAERGIKTLEDVERAISYDEGVYSMANRVMKQFSMSRKPTMNELDCVRRWISEWKLTEEDVVAACALTTKSRSPSIAYLDAILRARVESGEDDARYAELKGIMKELNPRNAVPTAEQVKVYKRWLEEGFERETILLAAKRCAGKNWHSFVKLEEMLGEWAENNARSLARAEIYLANKKQAYLEMKRLMQTAGLSRSPSNDDVGKYEGWKDRFSAEILSFAAECANGKGKPIPYMEKLLSEWEKSNISTLEAAREDHSRAAAKAPEKAARQNYQQHDYTEDDFKDIFYDPAKDYGEGGEQQ
ncbi:MAG: DnaD domain protein [Clostridia bacterium]|nr:DnaD domain protein [Clostridia bacterium]